MHLSRRAALISAGLGLMAPRIALAETAAAAAPERIEAALAALDDLVRETLQQTGVPGLSLAVVHGDASSRSRASACGRRASREAVDDDTVFQLASMSKPIAATVVAALVGDGRVAWDDPIVRHDPDFAMQDAWVTREITLARHVLPPQRAAASRRRHARGHRLRPARRAASAALRRSPPRASARTTATPISA